MSNRYSTNQFYNFTKYETVGYGPNVRDVDDNPGFIWPKPAVRNAANGTNVAVSRGYMRMLSQAYGDGADLAKRRFHFQFNPDVLVTDQCITWDLYTVFPSCVVVSKSHLRDRRNDGFRRDVVIAGKDQRVSI